MGRLVNAHFQTRYCKPFYSFTHKRRNEPSRCALGTNSGNQKLRDRIAPNTLITINGDILDRKMGLELAEKYGIDGVMTDEASSKIHLRLKKSQESIAVKNI